MDRRINGIGRSKKMLLNMFLQQRLFIVLIYQLFLCYGSWATRTLSDSIPVVPSVIPLTIPTAPIASSSEATLLTTRLFAPAFSQVQTQNYYGTAGGNDVENTKINRIPMSTSAIASTEAETSNSEFLDLSMNPLASLNELNIQRLKTPYKVLSIHSNCTRDLFEMHIELNRDFHGLLYAYDFPWECRARGTAQTNVTLRLPTSGCGVRVEPQSDGNMELSVRVMLQMEHKLRQSSDILRTVRCILPINAMGMHVQIAKDKMRPHYRNGRTRIFDKAAIRSQHIEINSKRNELDTTEISSPLSSILPTVSSVTTSTPRVRIWLELWGPDGSDAVEVGQLTTLTVRAIVPGTMGVRVVDCAALDGLGESTQQLLDERGCPIDEQVMPALHTHFKPVEEGWSKLSEDDLLEKTFTATFPAFKFPDRERLHVSCGVQLCKKHCPKINCNNLEKLHLSSEAHLARIEVFNSLAVTAPQIEVDRLRYDRRDNMSAEEYPPKVRPFHAEGTLCLSVSKLAISFCVLGLIFLIAVIVAICSLIRTRKRSVQSCSSLSANGNRLHRSEVCTSMFSSSSESAQSARFGSKLFMPYYPNALPYGRVY